MKQHIINTYQFNELSEDAKQTALEELYDINVDYDWWEFVYEDAKNIGIELTGFSLYVKSQGNLIFDAIDVKKAIMSEHGKQCETYKTVMSFDFRTDVNDDEFLQSLLEDYNIMLQREYEHRTSEDAIIETIELNEYDFTANGSLY